MATLELSAKNCLDLLLEKANHSAVNPQRLKDWRQVIRWEVDGKEFYWQSNGKTLEPVPATEAGFVMKCSLETLRRIAEGKLPFFIAVWGSGEIQFEGSFADAYRLGYIFLSDQRKRRVIFVSHCWLNTNTRFPEGCAFEGATTPLVKTLLDAGLGIIQMPCPEYECLGLEKQRYGEIVKDELRAGFRKSAQIVAKQIEDYLALGFGISGVLGMNPSPSCGVDAAKGKGTILGTSRDMSEKPEAGVFIEELQKLLDEKGISGVSFFAVRRLLSGETGLEERLNYLKSQIQI